MVSSFASKEPHKLMATPPRPTPCNCSATLPQAPLRGAVRPCPKDSHCFYEVRENLLGVTMYEKQVFVGHQRRQLTDIRGSGTDNRSCGCGLSGVFA
jgi:hypothetical protein